MPASANSDPVPPENLSRHYGFTRNPYDPAPLGIQKEDSALFVGRERESKELRTFIASFDRGAIFVEGGIGVGKTSFVNVQEYRFAGNGRHPGIISTIQPIQLASALKPTEFLLSVLSNVLSSLESSAPKVRKSPKFRRLSLSVTQSLIETRSWQVAAGGFGGGLSKEVTVANPQLVLLPSVSEMLDQAAQLVVESNFEKIVVNVNNLDLISPQDLAGFLDLTRDLTLIRAPFLWVFIGPIGCRSEVAQRTRRVSELIRTDPIWLPPLSLSEIHGAIEARVSRYRTSAATTAPIPETIVDQLYESSSGELRYILNRCTDILVRTMIEFPTSRQIPPQLAQSMLRQMTLSAIERCNLTTRQKSVLGQLVTLGPSQPRDFRKFGFGSAPGFLAHLTRFYEIGLVDRRRRGSDVVYTPRGDAQLALRV
jgi:hypothetical protein